MPGEKRHCIVCQEEIHGRRDKKYCSDYCRANYFNNINAEVASFMRRVNFTIRKNRSILSKLNPRGKTRIHKTRLVDSGMNFDYFTNIYKTKNGKTYYFCYDQGYLPLADDYFALVAKEDYVS